MSATYTIKLTRPSLEQVTVAWATRDGTAKAGLDYQASAGSVTFAPGETRKTISVPIPVRTDTQLVRSFDVVLNGPINADLADSVVVSGKRTGRQARTFATPPTTGAWEAGAVIYNISPVELGTAGAKYMIAGWFTPTVVNVPAVSDWLQTRMLTGN